MNILAMSTFVESLSRSTISSEIQWKSLNELAETTEENNKALFFTIFETEFHSVMFLKSFYCHAPASGYVYLIHERFESGYDGSVISGPNIYIQKDSLSKIHKLDVPLGLVYQLENAILSSRTESDDEIQSFIDNFYKN